MSNNVKKITCGVVCGIRERQRNGFFACFPLDVSRCKTWVRMVGNEDFVHIPIEKFQQIRHVCADHFVERDFVKTKTRLKKRAFPRLNLTAPPLTDEQMKEFLQHMASKRDEDNLPAESNESADVL